MQSIIANNVRCTNPRDRIKLIIYYKSQTVTSLVMRNNQAPPIPQLQQTNLIYEFKCTQGDCEHLPNASYVGLTTTTLSRRLTMHLQSGAPKDHTCKKHVQTSFNRELMVQNTKIIRKENDFSRLQRYEALLIQQKNPIINNQETGSCRTLKLFNFNNSTSQQIHIPQRNRTPVPHHSPTPSSTRGKSILQRRARTGEPVSLSQPARASHNVRRTPNYSSSQPVSRAKTISRSNIPLRRSSRLRNTG